MTALLLTSAVALPSLMHSLRLIAGRLGDTIDAAVSARAARAVPEWQMRRVQSDVRRGLRKAQTRRWRA